MRFLKLVGLAGISLSSSAWAQSPSFGLAPPTRDCVANVTTQTVATQSGSQQYSLRIDRMDDQGRLSKDESGESSGLKFESLESAETWMVLMVRRLKKTNAICQGSALLLPRVPRASAERTGSAEPSGGAPQQVVSDQSGAGIAR